MSIGAEKPDRPRKAPADRLRGAVGVLARLVLLSFLVGVVLSFFDLTPERIFENFGQTVADAYGAVIAALEWAVPYVALGAVLVLPAWAVLAGLDWIKRRR